MVGAIIVHCHPIFTLFSQLTDINSKCESLSEKSLLIALLVSFQTVPPLPSHFLIHCCSFNCPPRARIILEIPGREIKKSRNHQESKRERGTDYFESITCTLLSLFSLQCQIWERGFVIWEHKRKEKYTVLCKTSKELERI